MVFLNDTWLVVTNHYGHCLEEIHFPNVELDVYAGQCGHSGIQYRAARLDMRIDHPFGLAFDGKNTIYFSLSNEWYILAITLSTGIGTEFCETVEQPRYMLYDKFSGNIMVSLRRGLGQLNPENSPKTLVEMVGGGGSIGTLDNLWLDTADGLTQLDNETWIIADMTIHRCRSKCK